MADYTRGTDLVSALKYFMATDTPDKAEQLADCHSELDCWRVWFGYEGAAKNLVELFNALGDNAGETAEEQVDNPITPIDQGNSNT